jgi:uncharacterized membrane protein YqhA
MAIWWNHNRKQRKHFTVSFDRKLGLMLRRALASSRYIVILASVSALVASVALIVHQAIVVAQAVFNVIRDGSTSPRSGKVLATGLIEAVDVFLIAIVAYIIGLGLYALFVDDTLPLPHWLEIRDLDDLKNHLVSIVIAVLAVLFLREAVARAGDVDLLTLAAALALMIAALTFYLGMKEARTK